MLRCKFCAIRGEKLAFIFFLLKEHCFKQSCIKHSSICTSGYFVVLNWPPCSERCCRDDQLFVPKHCSIRGSRPCASPVCCDQCIFTPSIHKFSFKYCWISMEKPIARIFVTYNLIQRSSWTSHQTSRNEENQQTKLINRKSGGDEDDGGGTLPFLYWLKVVLLFAIFFILARPLIRDGGCSYFPSPIKDQNTIINVQQKSLCIYVFLFLILVFPQLDKSMMVPSISYFPVLLVSWGLGCVASR